MFSTFSCHYRENVSTAFTVVKKKKKGQTKSMLETGNSHLKLSVSRCKGLCQDALESV